MRNLVSILILATISCSALAGADAFTTGPIFTEGLVADIDETMIIPEGTSLKHSFDVSNPAPDGQANTTLLSAARFINMHARAGITGDNVEVAVVVHGRAVMDVSDEESTSAELIAALTEHGVRIIVCGQSATYYDVATDDLLPGVEMALSAMTAHAVLQQQGFTVNPF